MAERQKGQRPSEWAEAEDKRIKDQGGLGLLMGKDFYRELEDWVLEVMEMQGANRDADGEEG